MNDEDVWIVGYYGKIYHSRDGSKQCYRKDAGITNALLGIDFVSENAWPGMTFREERRGKRKQGYDGVIGN